MGLPEGEGAERRRGAPPPRRAPGAARAGRAAAVGARRGRGEEREERGRRVVLEVVGDVRVAERVDVEEAERGKEDAGEEQDGGERPAPDPPARGPERGDHGGRGERRVRELPRARPRRCASAG